MSIPARHREALQQQAEGRVTLTKHPDGCLLLFPRPEWETFRSRIAALPMDAHWWKRIFLGNAADVEMDGAGRVLIAPELRSAAMLDKEVSVCSVWAAISKSGTPPPTPPRNSRRWHKACRTH